MLKHKPEQLTKITRIIAEKTSHNEERMETQMDGRFKLLLLAALILYVISPLDLVPGPIDDIILCLAYVVTRRRISARKASDIENNEY